MQASRSTGVTPYFLVYGSEAILLADITFRAPRVENYDEEQAEVFGLRTSIGPRKNA